MNRHLDLPGLINFRDLGNYPALDLDGQPRRVKTGSLYRSGHFHEVNGRSQQALEKLCIQQLFDFRTAKERERKPSRMGLNPEPQTHWLPLDPGSGKTFRKMAKPAQSESMGSIEIMAMMSALMRSLVIDHARIYKEFLAGLVERPVCSIMHCASGKDRTGVAAALLLAALGVDKKSMP